MKQAENTVSVTVKCFRVWHSQHFGEQHLSFLSLSTCIVHKGHTTCMLRHLFLSLRLVERLGEAVTGGALPFRHCPELLTCNLTRTEASWGAGGCYSFE